MDLIKSEEATTYIEENQIEAYNIIEMFKNLVMGYIIYDNNTAYKLAISENGEPVICQVERDSDLNEYLIPIFDMSFDGFIKILKRSHSGIHFNPKSIRH